MVRVDIQDGLWENTPDKVKTPGIVNAGAIHKITYSRQSCMLRHKLKGQDIDTKHGEKS